MLAVCVHLGGGSLRHRQQGVRLLALAVRRLRLLLRRLGRGRLLQGDALLLELLQVQDLALRVTGLHGLLLLLLLRGLLEELRLQVCLRGCLHSPHTGHACAGPMVHAPAAGLTGPECK